MPNIPSCANPFHFILKPRTVVKLHAVETDKHPAICRHTSYCNHGYRTKNWQKSLTSQKDLHRQINERGRGLTCVDFLCLRNCTNRYLKLQTQLTILPPVDVSDCMPKFHKLAPWQYTYRLDKEQTKHVFLSIKTCLHCGYIVVSVLHLEHMYMGRALKTL